MRVFYPTLSMERCSKNQEGYHVASVMAKRGEVDHKIAKYYDKFSNPKILKGG